MEHNCCFLLERCGARKARAVSCSMRSQEVISVNRKLALVSLCALVPLLSVPSQAQQRGVQLWLTTADRSSLFALQPAPLEFSASSDALPVVDVNDMARYQSMDGFGLALTGGSAQLLMRMDPAQRSALLKELFATEGNDLGISYLRVSIGSSDMNDHVFSYDDLAAGETDVDQAKFSLVA